MAEKKPWQRLGDGAFMIEGFKDNYQNATPRAYSAIFGGIPLPSRTRIRDHTKVLHMCIFCLKFYFA